MPLAIIACVFLLFLREKALAERIENEAIVDSLQDQFAVDTEDGKSRLGRQKTT